MSKKNHNLLIVAHPDDETIFFAGLLLMSQKENWHVVCVTDGNADGKGLVRAQNFTTATSILGVKHAEQWDLPDRFETRINIKDLNEHLKTLPRPKKVFTHGPLGEYGHPHHQDISLAIHEYFHKKCPVYSVAHNCAPDLIVKLTPKAYQKKCALLAKTYFSETERFINFVPALAVETFAKIDLKEVREVHRLLTNPNANPKLVDLQKYKWFAPYFKALAEKSQIRPF